MLVASIHVLRQHCTTHEVASFDRHSYSRISDQQDSKLATMAAIWNKVKNKGIETKLQGNISLLSRESNTRKKKFGVDLYDCLTTDKNKLLSVAAGTIFQSKQAELKQPFDTARDDMSGIQARRDIKQKDLDVLEVKGAHTMPDSTAGEKVKKAGASVSNAAAAAKIKAEMALLDREMKIRKEQFGLEVFELTKASDEAQKKGIKGAVAGVMSGLSQQEKDIQACIDEAKADVALIEAKITSKRREIEMLDDGVKINE